MVPQSIPSVSHSIRSGDSSAEEKDLMALSEDEEKDSELSPFTGLFKLDLFKPLLHKAISITSMESETVTESDPNPGGSGHLLFTEPAVEAEVVPSSKLFLDIVKQQWHNPGAGIPPSKTEPKLYNIDPDLADILQIPTVDKPVATLTLVALIPVDGMDCLRPDDKEAEVSLRKSHQSAAWAVKPATLASFFNCASLLWLRQLQECIPPEDLLHQDINKLIAADEF